LIREEDTDTNLILEDILNPNKEYKRILDIPLMRDESSILLSSLNNRIISEGIVNESIRGKMEVLLQYIENPTKLEDDFLEILEYCRERGFIGLYSSLKEAYSMIFTKRILELSDERLI
jgi:hypothetical protein